jgi:hypothetical protein
MGTLSAAGAIAALGTADDELGQVIALHRAAGVREPERLALSVGDRRLLALHRSLTGRDVEVAATCAECETVSVAVLSAQTVAPHAERTGWLCPGSGLREPTYGDLLDLPADAQVAEAELVRRCIVGAMPPAPDPEALERIDGSLAGPIALACACGAVMEVAADVERLVLEGLQRHAGEIEVEIHLIADAYGWSLPAIEDLPDERRRRFARLVADGR